MAIIAAGHPPLSWGECFQYLGLWLLMSTISGCSTKTSAVTNIHLTSTRTTICTDSMSTWHSSGSVTLHVSYDSPTSSHRSTSTNSGKSVTFSGDLMTTWLTSSGHLGSSVLMSLFQFGKICGCALDRTPTLISPIHMVTSITLHAVLSQTFFLLWRLLREETILLECWMPHPEFHSSWPSTSYSEVILWHCHMNCSWLWILCPEGNDWRLEEWFVCLRSNQEAQQLAYNGARSRGG